MPNRRGFLQSALVSGLALAAPALHAEEPRRPDPTINDTMCDIVFQLRQLDVIDRVDEYLVDDPTIGLAQWRWAHFHHAMEYKWLPLVDRVNNELFSSMEPVLAIDNAGLDELSLEGLIKGREEEQIEYMKDVHWEMIQKMLTKTVVTPIGFEKKILPHQEDIMRACYDMQYARTPVSHDVETWNKWRRMTVSPLGRLGVGYKLHMMHSVRLLAAEDPVLDAQADAAQESGNEELFQQIQAQRDANTVAEVRKSRRRMFHSLLGFEHDLRREIARSMKTHRDTRISHVVVTTKGVTQAEKLSSKQ